MAAASGSRVPARVVWFDAQANLRELSTRQGVEDTVAKCRWANVEAVIVDVKPLSGLVLYSSEIAPRLAEKCADYPVGYDLLETVIECCSGTGVQVHAAVNVFSEGSQKLGLGRAFDSPDWQCVECTLDPHKPLRRVGEDSAAHHAVFVNPLNPDVQDYELALIREICGRYPIDGIVFDRLRYPNIYSDFSPLSRRAFEAKLGRSVDRWPQDVLVRNGNEDFTRGPLFKDWLRFRAQVIRDFLNKAVREARSVRPDLTIGSYVGSWYHIYYDVGVNWGGPNHRAGFDWWPDGYEGTGYADLLDWICTGCYYECVTCAEARAEGLEEWRSVEAAARDSVDAVEGNARVCGSLYLLQYEGCPEAFRRAVRQCLDSTDGCMLFDLVYLRDYEWWNIVRAEFARRTGNTA